MTRQEESRLPVKSGPIAARLRSDAYFVILLPVFFVLHAVAGNFGFIRLEDCLLLTLMYVAATVIVYWVCRLLLRNRRSAAFFSAALMVFFLFYGAFKDFLAQHLPFISRYTILLPLCILALVLVFFYVRKDRRVHPKLYLFLNLLFLIYIIVDSVGIATKLIRPAETAYSTSAAVANSEVEMEEARAHPTIYLIIMDEYAASAVLKANHGFSNPIDSFLLSRRFHLLGAARSNYACTWNSIGSLFNMSYIAGIDTSRMQTVAEINQCLGLLKTSRVVDYLRKKGYQFVNYSPFDFAYAPSPARQLLLPVGTRLINDNTLFGRMYLDLGWMLADIGFLGNIFFYEIANDNEMLRQRTQEYSRLRHPAPGFIYTHLTMPHGPWFYEKNGRLRTRKEISADDLKHPPDPGTYLEYLQFTNTKIRSLIDTIQTNTKGQAVIFLIGDHGFRRYFNSNLAENFRPLDAVYLPSANYRSFYDSISLVNQFPVLFNTLFNAHFPLLKDSTIFLPGNPSIP